MTQDDRLTVILAIGRLFRILSRPHEPGDEAEYDRCREIIRAALDGGEGK